MGIVPIVAHSAEPARYAVMDIETADADDAAVAVAKELLKAPKNWKEETVERKRPEREAAIERKAALLDASPITCLSLKTDRIAVLFNGMSNEPFDIPGWVVLPCEDEKGLLMTLRVLLNASTCQSTELVGQNFGFDIGKLRNAYMRHRLYLPCALMPGDGAPPMFDLMRQIRYFSTEYHNEPFVSLEVIARILGLPQPKQVIKGSDCPRLYKEGRYQEILIYNAIDAETTERAYLLMTGNAPDLA